MSGPTAAQLKADLLGLLRKSPLPQRIETIGSSQQFKQVHEQAAKYAKNPRPNPAELQRHLNYLRPFYQ